MYTAKITQKIQDPSTRVWIVDVEFSNGEDTFIESIRPQDRAGFDHWLNSRLQSLNSLKDFVAEDNVNKVIEKVEPTVVELTQKEIDRNTWLEKYRKWVRIKQTVVDTGIVPATNPKIVAMLEDLKATLKAEYIDFI
jgi:acyl carrier protein phosphodiesterase